MRKPYRKTLLPNLYAYNAEWSDGVLKNHLIQGLKVFATIHFSDAYCPCVFKNIMYSSCQCPGTIMPSFMCSKIFVVAPFFIGLFATPG